MDDTEIYRRFAELEQRLVAVETSLGVPRAAEGHAAPVGITPEIRQLASEGNVIEAIKRYRAATGASLADAKDAVEGLRSSGLP
jgi:ribosomal protein L7/L12